MLNVRADLSNIRKSDKLLSGEEREVTALARHEV